MAKVYSLENGKARKNSNILTKAAAYTMQAALILRQAQDALPKLDSPSTVDVLGLARSLQTIGCHLDKAGLTLEREGRL